MMCVPLYSIAQFLEVFVDCPLAVCQARDRKGTYAKAKTQAAKTVPGAQELYEVPIAPDLRLDSTVLSTDEAADQIIALFEQRGLVPMPVS